MKPTPKGWPRIAPALYYDKPAEAIDWLCRALGFEVRLKVEGDEGQIIHSELTFGDGLIMVSGGGAKETLPHGAYRKTPGQVDGANTQNLMLYVDDAEASCARARAAGAVIVKEPETHDYGDDYWADRTFECIDVGGHHWWIAQRVRSGQNW